MGTNYTLKNKLSKVDTKLFISEECTVLFNTASAAATSYSRRIEMIIIKTKEKGVKKNINENKKGKKKQKRWKYII